MTDEPLPGMPEPYKPPDPPRIVVDLTAPRTTCIDCGGPLERGDRGRCVDCVDQAIFECHMRINAARARDGRPML